jgi:hypothetical protein
MANLHKFTVTNKVANQIEVAGDLYERGESIYLPEHQANHYSQSSYITDGFLEYDGEVEVGETDMTPEFMDLYNAKFNFDKNILPAAPIKLASGLVKAVDPFGLPGADSAGGFKASRRLYIDKIGVKYTAGNSVASAGVRTPWHLVTAGDCTPVTPSVLTGFDLTAGTYTAATNGSIAAAAPITWAANDMLIVGYSEKFASVVCDMTAANTANTTITVWYWTASGWKEFLDENDFATTEDYTMETSGRTLSRAAAGDKARIVWWSKPTDWIAGGPNGSGINSSTYCVGIKFSGALTNLAGCSVYPVLDRPIADIKLGSANFGTENYYTYKAGVWSYGFDINGWGAAGDAIYISTDNMWDSLYIDMSANVNAVATGLAFAYWNGVEWLSMSVTDGTAAVPGTPFAQDGWLTITSPLHPSDWKKCLGTTINSNLSGTRELYWFRITRVSGGTTSANTAITSVENQVLATRVWHYFDVQGEGFVDDGENINVICMLEDADVDGVEIMAIASDV